VIRVWIETSSAAARAGFKSLLESDGRIEVVQSPLEADVILREELPIAPESSEAVPIVVVGNSPVSLRAFQGGVRAILSREAAPEQIVAALHAVSAGLIALPAEYASLVMHAGPLEGQVETLTPREMEALEMLAAVLLCEMRETVIRGGHDEKRYVGWMNRLRDMSFLDEG